MYVLQVNMLETDNAAFPTCFLIPVIDVVYIASTIISTRITASSIMIVKIIIMVVVKVAV